MVGEGREVTDAVPKDRVSVIGDIDVPDSAVEALAKGPGFAIAKTFTKDELQDRLQTEIAALAKKRKRRPFFSNLPATPLPSNGGVSSTD